MTHTASTTLSRIAIAAFAVAMASAAGAQSASSSATVPAKALKPAPAASGTTTPSGLVYKSLREGKGPSPLATDTVKVNYRGTFPDGREFDSSYSRNEPTTFPLNRVIKCWTEGVQMMKTGGKAQLTCPPQIAYGERGAGTVIPPNATLNFEIELLEINPH